MSFIYCHLNFHASLLRPWRFPLEKNPKECLKENLIRVTRRVSYKRHNLLTHREHSCSPTVFWWGPCSSSILVLFVILLCVFTFWVLCCYVRYDFRIKRCSVRIYLQLFVGGRMYYLRYLYFVVFLLCLSSSCVYFASFSRLSFLIAPSVFVNVHYIQYMSLSPAPVLL